MAEGRVPSPNHARIVEDENMWITEQTRIRVRKCGAVKRRLKISARVKVNNIYVLEVLNVHVNESKKNLLFLERFYFKQWKINFWERKFFKNKFFPCGDISLIFRKWRKALNFDVTATSSWHHF